MNDLFGAAMNLFGFGEPKKAEYSQWKRKTCKSCIHNTHCRCEVKRIYINNKDKACASWESKK